MTERPLARVLVEAVCEGRDGEGTRVQRPHCCP